MMNKKLIVSSLFAVASIAGTTPVLAHPWYIGPANAVGACADCHVGGTRSKNFVPGLIELFPIDQNLAIQDKIKAIFKLTNDERLPVWKKWDAIINPKATTSDTMPALKVGAAVYNYTIGSKLVIPFKVMDKEKDTYTIDQGFGDELVVSKSTAFNKNNVSTFKMTVSNIPAEYVGETFPMEVSVKEDQRKKGRILQSKVVKFNVHILPKKMK